MAEVFRYRTVGEFVKNELETRTVYYASPSTLNDPFDCQVDPTHALRRAIRSASGKEQKAYLRSLRDTKKVVRSNFHSQVGVCCFTTNRESSLMWSYYGDCHKGICIGYENMENFVKDEDQDIMGWAPVTYGENLLTEWLLSWSRKPSNRTRQDFGIELIKQLLKIKKVDWSKEDEWRSLRIGSGTVQLPDEVAISVCFGLRTSGDDRAAVERAAGKAIKPVKYFQVQRTDSDFGIVAKPL